MNRAVNLTEGVVVDIEDVSAVKIDGSTVTVFGHCGPIVSVELPTEDAARESFRRVGFAIGLYKERRERTVYVHPPSPRPPGPPRFPYPKRGGPPRA